MTKEQKLITKQCQIMFHLQWLEWINEDIKRLALKQIHHEDEIKQLQKEIKKLKK